MNFIPALTIHQPWARSIFLHGKDVENRSWETKYRGPLWIHASKTITPGDVASWQATVRNLPDRPVLVDIEKMDKGAIIGLVTLFECQFTSRSLWWSGNGFAFVLLRPALLPRPVPLRGFQGFFDPDRGWPESNNQSDLLAAFLSDYRDAAWD